MPLIWSATEAFQQPEKPDPAFNLARPADDAAPTDLSIFQNMLTMAAAVLALSQEPAHGFAGNIFNLMGALLSECSTDITETKGLIDDAALHVYLDNLGSSLQGFNDNVTVLSGLDPSAQSYKDYLISLNALVTAAMPGFQQEQYRRFAMTLFVAAASIHLGVLRRLVAADSAAAWVTQLRTAGAAYANWLTGTKQAIVEQRIGEIGDLIGSTVVYIRDSFHDSRLVGGDAALVNVSPALTALESRHNYIAMRAALFSASAWMRDIDRAVVRWQQLSKLSVLDDPAKFGPIPDLAVFPGIGDGGSYVDLASRLAWDGPGTLVIFTANGTAAARQTRLQVPQKQETPILSDVLIDVTGAFNAPIFKVRIEPIATRRVVIRSQVYPQAHLRVDGRGVTGFKSDGQGVVNCQVNPQSWETLDLVNQGDGVVTIASTTFPNVSLRMDGRLLDKFRDNGGGSVNCQFGAGGYEKFRLVPQTDGTVAIASVEFPNIYLRMDGSTLDAQQDAGAGGVVNCQFGVGTTEKFFILDQSAI